MMGMEVNYVSCHVEEKSEAWSVLDLVSHSKKLFKLSNEFDIE